MRFVAEQNERETHYHLSAKKHFPRMRRGQIRRQRREQEALDKNKVI